MTIPTGDFDNCVFINCPFDDDYMPLLRVLIFTVVQCGFRPRIATERADSGEGSRGLRRMPQAGATYGATCGVGWTNCSGGVGEA